MYIQKVIINNIRSISHFEMDFPNPAGWHVLIGDNGSGKTTILRAIGAVLIVEIIRVNPIMTQWLKLGQENAKVKLTYDDDDWTELIIKRPINGSFNIDIVDENSLFREDIPIKVFSVGYGSLRIVQENKPIEDIKPQKLPQILAHETLLSGKTTLMSAELWLKDLQFAVLAGDGEQELAKKILDLIIIIINETSLLPYNVVMEKVGRTGILFRNTEGIVLGLKHLSDGFRSILNIVIDLIYRMVGFYGENEVIKAFDNPLKICSLSGVVLIDEIDAHLHPTWQTRIGQWFTQYFPNIQFIVTTHSPLVCRACEKGSIWRLAAPDSEIPSGEIIGTERDRLIYGNILDAYGTEAFGESPVRSEKSDEMLQRLGELNMRAAFGKITTEEEKERQTLQQIFQTDVTIS